MKTFLYATDLSENSISAFHFAVMLSEQLKAKLHVLHVFDMKATFISTVSLTYAKREEIMYKEQFEKLKEFCKKHHGLKLPDYITLNVEENSFSSTGILEKAESLNADLILVGTKGSSLIKDIFLGSTATNLIKYSYVPVLAIPLEYESKPIRKIIYATAFEEADILAIRKLVGLAEPFGAEIKLIHVSTEDEYAGKDQMEWFREMLESKVEYDKINFDLRFSDDVFNTLFNYFKEEDASIIAMLEREGPGFFKGLWHKDTVSRMKLQIDRPLLSYHKNNLMQNPTIERFPFSSII
ncbi:universal stress protein [Muriicola soli]|uniref:Universal stress protein n=1 Tax=Muriicola soli TaxID=2507538 RepID=A0A411E9W5_9FLAO|nr:universal stress protein [Muriicola soli]QBA64525.1 universal stress protein [Muriicola soli]